MTDQLDEDAVARVPGDCEAATVHDVYARLQDIVAGATPETPLRLDLTGTRPTAFALQLLLAAGKSLDRGGAFAGYGPGAAAALALEG